MRSETFLYLIGAVFLSVAALNFLHATSRRFRSPSPPRAPAVVLTMLSVTAAVMFSILGVSGDKFLVLLSRATETDLELVKGRIKQAFVAWTGTDPRLSILGVTNGGVIWQKKDGNTLQQASAGQTRICILTRQMSARNPASPGKTAGQAQRHDPRPDSASTQLNGRRTSDPTLVRPDGFWRGPGGTRSYHRQTGGHICNLDSLSSSAPVRERVCGRPVPRSDAARRG